MSHAKPVVAFHTGGVPEVVAHDETGILVELDNISALAHALVRLIQDKELRQKMGRCGFERVRASFPAKRMVAETVACYRRVISGESKANAYGLR